jgi:hypothetical protein
MPDWRRFTSKAEVEIGTKYRIIHQAENQKYPRHSVLTFLGSNVADGSWDARPFAGTQSLPWSWIKVIAVDDRGMPHVMDQDARRYPGWAGWVSPGVARTWRGRHPEVTQAHSGNPEEDVVEAELARRERLLEDLHWFSETFPAVSYLTRQVAVEVGGHLIPPRVGWCATCLTDIEPDGITCKCPPRNLGMEPAGLDEAGPRPTGLGNLPGWRWEQRGEKWWRVNDQHGIESGPYEIQPEWPQS